MPKNNKQKTNKQKLSYTELNKLRLESLAKGRQTVTQRREAKKAAEAEEKLMLSKMSKSDKLNYLLKKDNSSEKENRNRLRRVVGTTKILDKFKTNLGDNIDLKASKAKNTLMLTIFPTKYDGRTEYSRKTVQNFGNNLSKYLKKLGLKGGITLETNFSKDHNLIRPGRNVDIGDNVEFYDPVVISGADENDEKLNALFRNASEFKGAKFYINLTGDTKGIKNKMKKI